jgi:hypothetical protein
MRVGRPMPSTEQRVMRKVPTSSLTLPRCPVLPCGRLSIEQGAPYASGWKPYGTELYWHDFRWPALPDRSRLLQPSLALHLTLNASTQIQEPAEAVACVPVTSISKVCAPKFKPVIE